MSFILTIYLCAVAVFILKDDRAKKALKDALRAGRPSGKPQQAYGRSEKVQGYHKVHPDKDPRYKSGPAKQPRPRAGAKALDISRIMDDREHDWLAGQLTEERAADWHIKKMFDMGHDSRYEHHKGCDADGIDTGSAVR